MRINGVRGAEPDLNVSAVRLPAWLARGIVLIRVGNSAVVLLSEFIVGRVRIRVATKPELLDKGVTLFVVAQVLESLAFLVGDDVGDVLIEPGFVGTFQLLPDCLLCL